MKGGGMDQDNFDSEDVPVLVAKTDTKDGPGYLNEDELPESDFEGGDDE
jgi:hypothetical protein